MFSFLSIIKHVSFSLKHMFLEFGLTYYCSLFDTFNKVIIYAQLAMLCFMLCVSHQPGWIQKAAVLLIRLAFKSEWRERRMCVVVRPICRQRQNDDACEPTNGNVIYCPIHICGC